MAHTTALAIIERCSPDFCLSAKERVESSRDASGDGAASDEDIDHPDDSDDLTCKFSYIEIGENKYE